VNAYRAGQQVPVVCQATGTLAYGSTIWDKTDDGMWVPDAYVRTGFSGFVPGMERCSTTTAPNRFRYVATTELNGRSATSLSAATVKTYAAGSVVTVTCQAIGENAYGSNIWDKTVEGLWVTDHYLKTGFDTFVPGVPRCTDNTSGSGRAFPTTAELNGRSTKSVTGAAVKVYPLGGTVTIKCQAYGAYAYGSYIWDKTSEDLWVADYYVRTGTTGFVSNMPRCDNDQPSGGSPSGTGGSPSTGGSVCDRAGHGRRSGSAGATTGTLNEKIARVITAAKGQTAKGLSYSWGGGGRGGPACGSGAISPGGHQDYNRYGFDCSGLTEYAFWAGAGIDIGPSSSAQSLRATRVPYSNARAGDLIFWGTPGHTSHVALLVGNGQIVEAAPPRGGNSVHIRSIYGSHSFAVRVIG
jgi:cell wall-associated NlpC family hydrolase